MKREMMNMQQSGRATAVVLALVLVLATGCRNLHPAARTDQQIATDVQAKIQGESALAGQNIQVSVANGVATLSGNVTDDASRALAGNDSGTVAGVKTVVNNLSVQPAQQAMTPSPQPAPVAQPAPVDSRPAPPARRPRDNHARRDREHDEQPTPAPPASPPAPATVAQAPAPAPVEPPSPPPPPKPVVKQVTLPAGTIVPVRVTETLDSKTAQPNDVFHGALAGDIGTQGVIAVPRGAPIVGRIIDAREAAHFKGNSLLSLELTQLTASGQKLTLVTDTYNKEGAARGRNTAEKAGGGAALGAIIGAIAGGGKGAAIGGLAGAGAGTGINAATRGQQAVIPTETIVNFTLRSPVTLTVTIPPRHGDDREPGDPQLEPR